MRSTLFSVLTLASQRYAITWVILLYSIGLIGLALIAFQPFVEISILTRDPLAITKGEFYFGLLSNIGIMLWCGTASLCIFTYFILRNVYPGLDQNFFLCSGLITLFLLVDDLFMLHESVFPLYLGMDEQMVNIVYLLFIGYLLIRYRYKILRTPYLILVSSLGFFGLAVIADTKLTGPSPYRHLFEDGFKFLGILGWFYYFIQTCYSCLIYSVMKKKQLQNEVVDSKAEAWGGAPWA